MEDRMMLSLDNYKGVFFDLGGTLIDAEKDRHAHLEILQEIILRYGIPISAEKALDAHYEYLVEETHKENFITIWDALKRSLHKLFSEYSPGINLDFSWIKKIYFKYHEKFVDLYPGVIDLLKFIKEKKKHLGVISDIDNDYMEFQLKLFGIIDMFDSITTSEEVRAYKPNPEIFQKALEKAKISGSEAIHVGDNYWRDIIGAKKFEITTILVGQPPEEKFIIDNIRPDYVVKNISEVKSLLNK